MKTLRTLPVLLAIALSGCVDSPPGNPKLSVAIAGDCDVLANPLPAPQPTASTDAGDAAAAYAVWGQQNVLRLRKYKACNERVRKRYSTGG